MYLDENIPPLYKYLIFVKWNGVCLNHVFSLALTVSTKSFFRKHRNLLNRLLEHLEDCIKQIILAGHFLLLVLFSHLQDQNLLFDLH